jgi:predicted MPP superfamily phosphohydrolase
MGVSDSGGWCVYRHVETAHRYTLLKARHLSLTWQQVVQISRLHLSLMNFVTMDLLLMERTKDTKLSFLGVHTLAGENRTSCSKLLVVVGYA